jgi:hypothetical protein
MVESGTELLADTSFSTGFYLREWTTVNGGPVVRHLDYGGSAKDEKHWTMARWWDPYDFVNATESHPSQDVWKYEDQSSYCLINPTDGEMTMNLNSWTEYQEKFGGSRNSASLNWSHFLIEQSSFAKSVGLSDIVELWADLTFNIEDVILFDKEKYNPSLHTAQLFWYLTIRNVVPEGVTDQGTNGDYMWFGIPLYDYRYNKIDEYHNLDSGVTGSTNKLIYSISNSEYLPVTKDKGIELGKEYSIHIDLAPFIKEAYVYGVSHGVLKNTNAKNMQIGYMNFGWELPGSFEVTSSIKNMSLKAVL